jgi:hypothetical protein
MQKSKVESLKKLVIWIIVLTVMIGVFYLISFIGGDSSQSEEKEVVNDVINGLTYSQKLENLLNSNYTFEFLVTKNNDKYKFEGIKEDNKIIGFKETKNNIIKFKIEDNQVYEIKLDDELLTNDLYEDIDASLLDLNNIVSLISQTPDNDIIITLQGDNTLYDYNFSSKEEGLEIIITEDELNITNINIIRNNETYDLTFTFDK